MPVSSPQPDASVGASSSVIVTLSEHVEDLPLLSVAVHTTVVIITLLPSAAVSCDWPRSEMGEAAESIYANSLVAVSTSAVPMCISYVSVSPLLSSNVG